MRRSAWRRARRAGADDVFERIRPVPYDIHAAGYGASYRSRGTSLEVCLLFLGGSGAFPEWLV
jgi:hypothetical protein